MSEASKSLLASTDEGQIGPDYFGFYTREIIELISQDEDSMPATMRTSELTRKKIERDRGKDTIDTSCTGTVSSFSDSIGAGFSDFRKERLKLLLRQGVFDLTREVDELLEPVLATSQLQSHIRNRKCASSLIGEVFKDDSEQARREKLKTSSSSSASRLKRGSRRKGAVSNGTHVSEKGISDKEIGEVDNDLQFLLESDNSEVEEIVKKYSDELSATLGRMEQQLEELLNAVMSRCRPMTRAEKMELRKLIQKLPQNNLDRVAEIVQNSKKADSQPSDEVFVNLEKEDNMTLWRLYYYVKAVETARELL